MFFGSKILSCNYSQLFQTPSLVYCQPVTGQISTKFSYWLVSKAGGAWLLWSLLPIADPVFTDFTPAPSTVIGRISRNVYLPMVVFRIECLVLFIVVFSFTLVDSILSGAGFISQRLHSSGCLGRCCALVYACTTSKALYFTVTCEAESGCNNSSKLPICSSFFGVGVVCLVVAANKLLNSSFLPLCSQEKILSSPISIPHFSIISSRNRILDISSWPCPYLHILPILATTTPIVTTR